jgi:hypothetical protein
MHRQLDSIYDRLTADSEGNPVFNTMDDYHAAVADERMRTDRDYARRVDEKFNRSTHLWSNSSESIPANFQTDDSQARGTVPNNFRPSFMSMGVANSQPEEPVINADDALTPNVLRVTTNPIKEGK